MCHTCNSVRGTSSDRSPLAPFNMAEDRAFSAHLSAARAALNSGDNSSAVVHYEAAVHRLGALGCTHELAYAATLLLLAGSLPNLVPPDRPAALLRAVEEGIVVLRSLDRSGSADVAIILGESLRLKGAIHSQEGKLIESVASFEEALSVFEASGDADSASSVLISLAYEMEGTGEFQKGLRCLDRAEALSRLLPAHDAALKRARIVGCRGNFLSHLRRYDEALACRKDALECDTLLFGRASREAAESLSMLASAYDELRQTALARTTYLAAISLMGELGLSESLEYADLLTNYASSLGGYEQALELLQRALIMYRCLLPAGHHNLAKAWRNVLKSLTSLGRHAEAAEARVAYLAVVRRSQVNCAGPGCARQLRQDGAPLDVCVK